jgi:ferrous iron transport protein B
MSVARVSSTPATPAGPPGAGAPPLLAIAGNPNSGKSTIFNLLTGLKQKVANYPGVTVEKKIGECYSQHGKKLRLIDLPGAYSLNARSPDEAVTRDVLLGRRGDTPRPDRVICVADASNLERNLYLVTQVLELGLPTIVVLNMMDVAEQKGWQIDVAKLSDILGVPVVKMQATTGKGLTDLKVALSREDLPLPKWHSAPLPADIREALKESRDELAKVGAVHADASLLEPMYVLSDHDPLHYGIRNEHLQLVHERRARVEKAFPGWEDQLVAARYGAIEELIQAVLARPEQEPATLSAKLDRVFLHPLWGGVCLVAVLALIFYLIFAVAEGPVGLIEDGFAALKAWVAGALPPGDLNDLIAEGALSGVEGVLVFLPQILILFFFIGIMEDTGYMARLAFIMDRFMGFVGLNGKAFLPFLSSYACAVPGVMAARTIESPKDRLITILVSPLASCSARLPVYFLLVATLYPPEVSAWVKGFTIAGLYALGTCSAFGFAWIFNKGLMKGADAPMILEMPTYKRPSFKSILLQVAQRAKVFLVRAGTIIFGISILIWAASTYPRDRQLVERLATVEERLEAADGNEAALKQEKAELRSQMLAQSFAGRAGHFIEPVIRPLGYDWKIGIGIIGSFAARELFGSTVSIVYAVEEGDTDEDLPLRERIQQERRPDGTRVFTPLVCLSLLIFYVYAMQCVSTTAIVKRETGAWKWAFFQLGYMTGTAYTLSFMIYQIGRALGYA